MGLWVSLCILEFRLGGECICILSGHFTFILNFWRAVYSHFERMLHFPTFCGLWVRSFHSYFGSHTGVLWVMFSRVGIHGRLSVFVGFLDYRWCSIISYHRGLGVRAAFVSFWMLRGSHLTMEDIYMVFPPSQLYHFLRMGGGYSPPLDAYDIHGVGGVLAVPMMNI